jgi:hypothetical protein
METFGKIITQILSLISFYPRWVQIIFVITFALLLVTIFLFFIYYSSASKQKTQLLSNTGLVLNLSVNNEFSADGVTEYFDSSDTETLTYKISTGDNSIAINPSMEYLNRFQNGGPISGLNFWWSFFKWQFPKLDLKIINNTNKTVYFTNAIFKIDSSSLDTWPILVIKENQNNIMKFELINEGWGEIRNCMIKYNIAPLNQSISFDGPYSHELYIGNFMESKIVDLSSALLGMGVDVPELIKCNEDWNCIRHSIYLEESRLKDALGPFNECDVLVFGEMIYSGVNNENDIQTKSLKFSTRVSLIKSGPGAPIPPSYYYQIMLDIDKNNYEISLPISQAIKAGETDRFNIAIGAKKSSLHVFKLKLIYNDNQSLSSPELKLRIIIPRSQADLLYNKLNQVEGTIPFNFT